MRKLIVIASVFTLIGCQKEEPTCNCYKQYQMNTFQTNYQWQDTYTEQITETNCDANGATTYESSQIRYKIVCQ